MCFIHDQLLDIYLPEIALHFVRHFYSAPLFSRFVLFVVIIVIANTPHTHTLQGREHVMGVAYAGQWFSRVFAGAVPTEQWARIIDYLLAEGLRALFHIALALVKLLFLLCPPPGQPPPQSAASQTAEQGQPQALTQAQAVAQLQQPFERLVSKLNGGAAVCWWSAQELIDQAVQFHVPARKLSRLSARYCSLYSMCDEEDHPDDVDDNHCHLNLASFKEASSSS